MEKPSPSAPLEPEQNTGNRAAPSREKTAIWGLLAVIGGIGIYLGLVMFQNRPAPAAATPPAPTGVQSSILGMTIPGALSGTQGLLDSGQEVARMLGMACTTSMESFSLYDDIAAYDAVNQKMRADGYNRTNIMTQSDATAFKANGPRDLLGIMHSGGFFICEY